MKFFYVLILVFLSACSTLIDTPIALLPTASITIVPSPTIVIPTLTPTLVSPTSVVPACQTAICNMPYSILVHSAQKDWLAELAPIINIEYVALTSSELTNLVNLGHPPQDNYVLISIDDLSTYYLPPRFYEMINNMREVGIVGTLAVVTEYPSPPDPEIWAYYRELQKEGWEIAIHTEHHYNFEWISNAQIKLEIKNSYDKICANTLRCPVTLILPFGKGYNFTWVYQVAKELDIIWIVGTDIGYRGTGNSFSGEPPYYASRAPIVESIDDMFKILDNMFPFEYSYGNE